ncbi:hypothetical protein [Tolypothrix sp. VBCCA 56010]|uniref:hypothetical protein n=1 Tax=Tolypothrix sp. VBCCA 56010 TaxID=3137731 RepID=UPI003D7E7D4F
MTAGASTERQSLQRGEPAQRAALGTSARHCLPNAPCPMPNYPLPFSQLPITNSPVVDQPNAFVDDYSEENALLVKSAVGFEFTLAENGGK